MDAVTMADRKNELRSLLEKIQAHPSADLNRERQRVIVLQEMIAGAERHKADA